MKDIDLFLDRIQNLTSELEKLGRDFSDLYKHYDGNDFENQNYLASNKLDDSILVATHEMASTIGFMAADIKLLTDFIDFRKTCYQLTDNELEAIIDHPTMSPALKLDLAKKLTNGDTKVFLGKTQSIQQLWNKTFENKSFQKIRAKFSIALE